MPQQEPRKRHALVAMCDPPIRELVAAILGEGDDAARYLVTRVDTAGDAFAVARAALHPLVVGAGALNMDGVDCVERMRT